MEKRRKDSLLAGIVNRCKKGGRKAARPGCMTDGAGEAPAEKRRMTNAMLSQMGQRVELQAHTKYSKMDAFTGVSNLIKEAYRMGMPAVAITDHGTIQAFPETEKTLMSIDEEFRYSYFRTHLGRECEDLERIAAPIKVIYGMEGYLLDDDRSTEAPACIQGSQRTFHVSILAKNREGLQSLYDVVSLSYLKFRWRIPRIPKELLGKYREGLLLGSGCTKGELYQAILEGRPEDEIRKIVEFYDYLEVLPTSCMRGLLKENHTGVASESDLRRINLEIVRLGERYGRQVVAVGDVHFLKAEDEIYRRVIQFARGFRKANNQPPLYLRTTEQMLHEFAYLGEKKAEEIVISNTISIAEQCEARLSPTGSLYLPKPLFPEEWGISKNCQQEVYPSHAVTITKEQARFYAQKYFDEHKLPVGETELAWIAEGIAGVCRTTIRGTGKPITANTVGGSGLRMPLQRADGNDDILISHFQSVKQENSDTCGIYMNY